MTVKSLVVLVAVLQLAQAAEWALLVAGSNGYYNYRHQSDVCHSYHVLINNGFPADHIVTMLYDDIANSPSNPVPGNMINQPDGPNVYKGCVTDYKGEDVTPKNFLKILAGKPMSVGSGRVIQSTSEDSVFVFFSDHGATGLIAFPSDELYADDLNKVLNEMYANKQYSKLLFYLEACESGSMFNGILSEKINVLAVTASDPTHSSYAIYYDSKRGTYLGDVFSVYWMQDSDVKDPRTETVGTQFELVKQETNTSAVCWYGDSSIKDLDLSVFIGEGKESTKHAYRTEFVRGEMADSRDVDLMILKHRVANADAATRPAAEDKLAAHMNQRKMTDLRFASIFQLATGGNRTQTVAKDEDDLCHQNAVNDFDCLKQAVGQWKSHCGPLDSYSLKHVTVFNDLCASVAPARLGQVIAQVCAGIQYL